MIKDNKLEVENKKNKDINNMKETATEVIKKKKKEKKFFKNIIKIIKK